MCAFLHCGAYACVRARVCVVSVQVEATMDPERARGHTVASNAAADEAGAERIMRGRQTGRSFVNYGYSENQVRGWRRSQTPVQQHGVHVVPIAH